MIVITVIVALLIMECKSDPEASDPELPCSEKLGYLSYPNHPEGQDCHLAYRQGPCDPAEILVSANNAKTGKCVRNLCETDGVVLFEHQCYELNTKGPCKPLNGQTYKFGVNPSTFRLECLPNSETE